MAKFALEAAIGNLNVFHYNFDASSMEISESSETSVEVADMQGDRMVLSGTGFEFDSGDPTAGTVTKAEFFDSDGDLLLTITDLDLALDDLSMTNVLGNFFLFEQGRDTFTGSSTGDFIMFADNKGNDKIFGLGGNDYILGSDGKNTIDGGAGNQDVLTYSMIIYEAGMKGITADLEDGSVINPWGKADKVKNIEDVRGTKFADTFIGTNKNEHFAGLEGNDTFTGGKGNDQFDYSDDSGKDKITDFGNGDDSMELAGLGVGDFGELKGLMEQKGKNVVINFGDGDVLTFLNFDRDDFSKNDFTIYDF
jgi:Ca2+-binding RTX toxin-like protein